MSDQWTDKLSDYLDGELPPDQRAELEAHLMQCLSCGAVIADLKRIVARAQSLEDREPAHDLWPDIAARIGATAGRQPKRWSFSLPQLAAAGIALAAVSGGAAWLLHPVAGAGLASRAPTPPIPVTQPMLGQADSQGMLTLAAHRRAAEQGYDGAVADLERVLAAGRDRLDTTTVNVIARNLTTIDSAIAQAQRALAADSASVYLNSHLAETRRRKLELLRQAAALVSSVS
ncbi:MAG TPA: zf-HC2 domain-containing protein [Gemmatimonadales bacterium]